MDHKTRSSLSSLEEYLLQTSGGKLQVTTVQLNHEDRYLIVWKKRSRLEPDFYLIGSASGLANQFSLRLEAFNGALIEELALDIEDASPLDPSSDIQLFLKGTNDM